MKKFIALLLVLCMVAGLVACKKPAEPNDGTTGSQSANQGGSNNNQGGSNNNQGGSNNQATTGTEGGSDNGGSDNGGSDNGGSDNGGGAQTPGGGGNMGGGIIGTGYTGETLSATGGIGLGGEIVNDFTNNDDLINPAFAGKTIQIYGYSSAQYDYIEDMGKGNYIWMMRAAIDEWAALNHVTVQFLGDYDQNAILGAINSGEKPDMLIECQEFPLPANMGLLRPFTDEEYALLAKTCGNVYLDMIEYKGKSYGVQKPWSGNHLLYYNETMFEDYGVKTPAEYYKEGQWTWDNFYKCMEEMSKDLDGDGVFDTYGCGWANVEWMYIPYSYNEAEDGTISHNFNIDMYRKLRQMLYDGDAAGIIGGYSDCNISTYPRPAMHVGDAEWYNFEHLLQETASGDIIRTIFQPTYQAGDEGRRLLYTQEYMSLFKTCDEVEACMSLLQYILRCGMRYMAEYSLGMYGCKYEGIRGVTEYSLGWRTNFQAVVEERIENKEAWGDVWDQKLWDMMYEDILKCEAKIGRSYPEVGEGGATADEINELPPASAMPLIIAAADSFCKAYNDLYINK